MKSRIYITSRFVFTPQHLVDTLTRYRLQHRGRWLWRWFRWVAAFIFVLVAFIGLFVPQYIASAFMMALAIILFFLHKIDDYLATRSFRNSPHCDALQVIHLSDDGFRAESEIEQVIPKWTAFSRAVIFNDGVLHFLAISLLSKFNSVSTIEWTPLLLSGLGLLVAIRFRLAIAFARLIGSFTILGLVLVRILLLAGLGAGVGFTYGNTTSTSGTPSQARA